MKKVTVSAKQEVTFSADIEMTEADWKKYNKIISSPIGSRKMDEQAAILLEKYNFPNFRDPSGYGDLEDVEVFEK